MKALIFIFMFGSFFGNAQKLPGFLSKSERKFVKNVISVTNDVLVDVTRRPDGVIVIEFWNTMYTLTDNGFIDQVWILEDEDWIALGREQAAY